MKWKVREKLRRLLDQETGTITKEWGGRERVALVYPNTYHVGMSNLGVHNIYRLINEQPSALCERVFLPEDGDPVLSMESCRPLADFDTIAFSVAFENDIKNIKPMLTNIGKDRPRLIIGGAVATLNPDIFKDMFDDVVQGDAEEAIPSLLTIAPSHHRTIAPNGPALHHAVQGPAHSVIWTGNTEFGNMHLVELQRGCSHACKFCAAPIIYKPFRQFSKPDIINAIDAGLPHRKKVGLIGGDVLAHPGFCEIAEYIHSRGATFSPSSVRADRITKEIARLLKESGHKTITLAPETASESMRRKIGKNIPDDKFCEAVQILAEDGIRRIKLYFMIGLPGETEEDVIGIKEFVQKIRASGAQKVSVSINPFVPKHNTPFEAEHFEGIKGLKGKINLLKRLLSRLCTVRCESPLAALQEYEAQNVS